VDGQWYFDTDNGVSFCALGSHHSKALLREKIADAVLNSSFHLLIFLYIYSPAMANKYAMKKIALLLLTISLSLSTSYAQNTYAEKLGFPKGAKVLILHVDDVGMSWDSNEGAKQLRL
jgi:hypothetical protein